MTWLTTFYLRAFAILLQVALIATDEEGNGKPKIIQPPQDMNIVAENATITCISSGSTPRTTTWQKDDRTLSINAFNHLRQSSDGSLHILLARRERDTGRYKCIVSNSVGTVFSREAHITFPYMDKFSTPDSQVFSDEGSREILRCHAPKSSPDRHIYWSKINPEQPNNPHFLHAVVADKHYYQSVDGDVYFSFTTSDDSAGYYCNVENQYMGKVLRRIVSLSVTPIGTLTNTPPKVWYLTRGRRAVKGEKFVLECIASGRPVPKSIKLYKADSSNELGSKSGNGQRHVFDRFQLSDVGQYVCDVMNDYGEKDRKTTFIGVDVKPEWRTIPTDTTAEIDGSATLWCNAIGVPEVTYEWYYNGNPLPNRRAFSVSGGNLTITSIQSHLSGMYQCVAKNKFGSITAAARLQVTETPAGFGLGSKPPQVNAHVLIGSTVEITCNPTGAPKPSIQWRNVNKDQEITTGGRFTILPSGNLKIKNVQKADEGRYSCTVSNKLGKQSKEGKLSVRAEIAIITAPPKDMRARQGQPITLTCGVETSKELDVSFQWEKNGILIKPYERIKITTHGKTSVLHISKAKQGDTGMYICRASGTSETGSSDQRAAYVRVQGSVPPPPVNPSPVKSTSSTTDGPSNNGAPSRPTAVTLTDKTEKEVKISWTLGRDNHSKVKRVYIQYRTAFKPEKWYDMKMSLNNQSRGHEILQLSPWVKYKFRVISENSIGNSTPSTETIWLETKPAAPSKCPKEIKSSGTGPTEMKISWQPLPKIDQNGPGIHYIVYHRQSGRSTMLKDEVVGKSSFVVKGTEYYVQYEFKIQAANDHGKGPESPILRGFTGERLPLGNPTDLQVRITSSTTAVAWWRGVKTSREVMRGEFKGYQLRVWKGKTKDEPKEYRYKVTRGNTTDVLNLEPWTSYMFQVFAYNKLGAGPGSNIVGPLETPEAIPGEPEEITVRDAEEGKVNLTWRQPVRPNGVIIGYIISYKDVTSDEVWQREANPSQLWITLTELKPAKTYEFSVQAKTKNGTGQPKKRTFNFTLLPYRKPDGVKITAKGPRMIILMWNPDNTASVTRYKDLHFVVICCFPAPTSERNSSEKNTKDVNFSNDEQLYCHKCLVDRLLLQGYTALRLEKSFKKFYGRCQDLTEKYHRSVKVYYWSQQQASNDATSIYVEKQDLRVSGLQPSTTYNFQVASVNQYGAGPKTDSIQGTTDREEVKTTKNPNEIVPTKGPVKSSTLSVLSVRTLNLFLLTLTAILLIQR